MFGQYLEELRREGRYSRPTLVIIGNWLEHFEKFCRGREPVKLKAKELETWRQELLWKSGVRGKLYSENTVNQAVLVVRRFYSWAVERGFVLVSPAAELKIRRVPKKDKREWTPTERRRLLSWPDLDSPVGIRDRVVLGILLATDISRPGGSRLDLDHVQLDTGALFATGRRRGVKALSDGLCADLERYLKESRPLLVTDPQQKALFLNKNGGRFSGQSVQALMRQATKSCDLDSSS